MLVRTEIRGRRGAALMVGLVCLVLLMALVGSMAKLALAKRLRQRGEERRMQAAWLAESALERAWARLAADSGYRGEQWSVSAQELGSKDGGRVAIVVEPVEGKADRKRIRVVADFPRDEPERARQSRSVEFEAGGDAPGENRR